MTRAWAQTPAQAGAIALGLGLALAACSGSAAAPSVSDFSPRTISVDTDWFDVLPGDEILVCTVTNLVLDAPFDVETVHGYQTKGGHHAALFYTTEPITAGPTHRCVDHESMGWQLVGAGAEGEEIGLRLPPGIAVHIPKGARIVVESHYVNAGRDVRRVRDRVTAESFADPSKITAYAGMFQVTDFALAIPPRTRETRTIECVVDADMEIIDLNGHAHETAERVAVSLQRGGHDDVEMLYDREWTPAFQFHPPTIWYPESARLRLRHDDRVRVTCTWNNTTDRTLRFPSEMCIGSMHYIPDRGYLHCGTAVSTIDG